MNALFTLRPQIDRTTVIATATLISLVFWIFPEISLAAELASAQLPEQQTDALVFEIKNSNTVTQISNTDQNLLNFDTIVQSDPLTKNLKTYLESKNSPLAEISDKIITYPHWQRALAISFVESHMCRFTPKTKTKNGYTESYNCSGIGGSNYRVYANYEGWFADMTNLLDKPNYVNRPIEKFIGYYVVPGSSNWLNGVKKTESDLAILETTANDQRMALQGNPEFAIATFQTPQLTKLNK